MIRKGIVLFVLILITGILFSANSETDQEKAQDPIVMIFGGDVTLGGFYPLLAPEPYEDFDWPFKKLTSVFSEADVIMVNCENAITRSNKKVSKRFNFKMEPELAEIFRRYNIQVALANNHVYDYGAEGLVDTLKHLDYYGVKHVGAGLNLGDARRPIIRSVEGKKIAFLAYGNYSPAKGNSPGIAYRNPQHVVEDIKKAKKTGSDYVIVNFHWGIERNTLPTKDDQDLAHFAIDNGADVIVGHHPHVLQPVEIYKGKIIAYSLGNFVFGGNSRHPRDSMLLEVVFNENALSYRKIPIRIDPRETRYQPYVLGNN